MGKKDTMPSDQIDDNLEWHYAPPPTPYDLVRDSFVMKSARLALHIFIHPFIHTYNNLNVINRQAVLDQWPCIITPNHSSHMDTMAVFSSLPLRYVNRLFALAAKDYFFRNGAIAFGSRLIANVIPLDRTGAEKTGLQLSLSKLEEGHGILVFPEGTRSVTGKIESFKKGAIMLSRQAKLPIIPTYIKGTLQSMPKATVFPKAVKISVFYGEPLRFWESPLDILGNSDAAQFLEQKVKTLRETLEDGKAR